MIGRGRYCSGRIGESLAVIHVPGMSSQEESVVKKVGDKVKRIVLL